MCYGTSYAYFIVLILLKNGKSCFYLSFSKIISLSLKIEAEISKTTFSLEIWKRSSKFTKSLFLKKREYAIEKKVF
ncbi:MAG: hypothetical protein B7Y25_03505 [Alphaproteobacteria bacterium 16-39-46]|nr:MAG: hypothetical protein B7Y25_03505 [Alphaproteobacteria bacterium 16-39-46]OZA43227.1 MAG: hypothetical protein B7X84_03730 [Alphaproteobacteria bacterium 17-39-52]